MGYRNRTEAGSALAEALTEVGVDDDAVVLGVPRGGVVVAAEVARRTGLPLDLALARKVGAPGHAELAVGAVAEDGGLWLNEPLLDRLGADRGWLEGAIEEERTELERRARRYRGGREPVPLRDRTALVVDDGVATGATLAAVLEALRSRGPRRVVAAVPVAPPETIPVLEQRCDQVVCPLTPRRFEAVGAWYADFTQTTDDEVVAAIATREPPG